MLVALRHRLIEGALLKEQVITSCERQHLTFLHGRSGTKKDQTHVEQKKRSVVREAVGCGLDPEEWPGQIPATLQLEEQVCLKKR